MNSKEKRKIIGLIKSHISKDRTAEAIKCLKECEFENGDKEITLLSGRHTRIQNDIRLGILSRDEAKLDLAKINLGIMDLLDFIKVNEDEKRLGNSEKKASMTRQSQLDKTIAKNPVKVDQPNFQLKDTLDKKITNISSTATHIDYIELETTDRRVQNNDRIFRVEESVLLGRHPDCNIVVLYEGVSRHHARISREGNDMIISDENSTNGTFWNDQRINQFVLKENGILRLDEVEFNLRVVKK